MTEPSAPTALSASELRRQFDDGFTRPVRTAESARQRYILVRVGTTAVVYGLALSDLHGVLPIGNIVQIPTRLPALLGLVAVRSNVMPVYGLASLLGLAQESPRWFVSLQGSDPVGLAFGHLEGYVEVVAESAADGAEQPRTERLLHTAEGAHRVLDSKSLLLGIRQQIGAHGANKEV
jgi:chemotaxis signal transduction protein